MKQKLIDLLSDFGFPVFLQGSLNPDEAYPESFFTFWVFEAPESAHYNNNPNSCDWGFWIYFYSSDPKLVETVPLQAKASLRTNGFVFEGKPVDAETDVETHTGVQMTCYFKEVYNNG